MVFKIAFNILFYSRQTCDRTLQPDGRLTKTAAFRQAMRPTPLTKALIFPEAQCFHVLSES